MTHYQHQLVALGCNATTSFPERFRLEVLSDFTLAILRGAVPPNRAYAKHWVAAVARNKFRDLLRRESKQCNKNISIDPTTLLSSSPEPLDLLVRAESRTRIREEFGRFLSSYPRAIRVAIFRHLVEGTAVPAIAAELSKPEQTVYSWIRRAKTRLAPLLREILDPAMWSE